MMATAAPAGDRRAVQPGRQPWRLVRHQHADSGSYFQTQDFFDPDIDISPLSGEVRHRVTGTDVRM
jgi:hypothetical protein